MRGGRSNRKDATSISVGAFPFWLGIYSSAQGAQRLLHNGGSADVRTGKQVKSSVSSLITETDTLFHVTKVGSELNQIPKDYNVTIE